MAKARSSLSTQFGEESVLDDLNSFLEIEEERLEVAAVVEAEPDYGKVCRSCINSEGLGSSAFAATANDHKLCLLEILATNAREYGYDLQEILAENGSSLAHLAASKGHVECLKVVLEYCQELAVAGDHRGARPLHVCAYRGHLECLRLLLLESKEEEIPRDVDNATPIHFAAAAGQLECLQVLMEVYGQNPDIRTASGETPGESRVLWVFLMTLDLLVSPCEIACCMYHRNS